MVLFHLVSDVKQLLHIILIPLYNPLKSMYPQLALIICSCKQDEYALGRVQREVEGVLLVDFGVDV